MEGINESSFLIRMTPLECIQLKDLFRSLKKNPSSVGFKSKNLTSDNKEIIEKIYNLFVYEDDVNTGIQNISQAQVESNAEYENE